MSLSPKRIDVSRPLQILYTNCDQLLNKFDELLTIVGDEKPDTILLTEVIPKAQTLPIAVPRISIPGFHLFTNFDPDLSDLGKSGCRGIVVYVAECLQPLQVSYQSSFRKNLCLNIFLDNNENLLVGNIYCSPSFDKSISTNKLCDLISYVCNTKPCYLLVVGDFNYPNIDWINGCLTGVDHNEQLFYDTLQDCVLFQLVTQPTRVRPDTDPHILDLILTNEETMHGSKY